MRFCVWSSFDITVVSVPFYFSNHLAEEENAGCLFLIEFKRRISVDGCYCSLSHYLGCRGLVCVYRISWSYSLAFRAGWLLILTFSIQTTDYGLLPI